MSTRAQLSATGAGRAFVANLGAMKPKRDQRSAPRRRTYLQSARLFDAVSGELLGEARVVDVSATGMQLVLDKAFHLPYQFNVYINHSGIQCCCTVARREQRVVGLRIVKALSDRMHAERARRK